MVNTQLVSYTHLDVYKSQQYLGFVVIMVGFLLLWPTLITLTMFPIMVVVYLRLARREGRDAAASFGEAWASYAQRTPGFWPRWSASTEGRSPTWKGCLLYTSRCV